MKRSMMFALTLSAAACGSSADPSGNGDGAEAARSNFREAFQEQRYDDIPSLIQSLEATSGAARDPAQHELILGHANLWKVGEWNRSPGQSRAEFPQYITGARTHFQAALDLNPEDERIYGWLGSTVRGIGSVMQDQAMIDMGTALIDTGVEKYPEFNLFVYAIARADEPRGSAELDAGIEAMWRTLDVCFGETVDRAQLDLTRYKSQQTDTGRKRVCWNTSKAPHNFEGFFLYFGDMVAKTGDAAAARAVYEQARVVSSYASWPYKTVLEDRVATLDDRTQRALDEDPANDSAIIAGSSRQCAACHAVALRSP